jgi:hypothetical protein
MVISDALENLKLEWSRYEKAQRWLRACDSCTGWSMVIIDTHDIFFQADPFTSLGDAGNAKQDLLFVEEVAQYTNTLPDKFALNIGASVRYKSHSVPCYGLDLVKAEDIAERPILLCSGTVIGSRNGIDRFLTVLVNEFYNINAKGCPQWRSPHMTTTMVTLSFQDNLSCYHGVLARC